VVCVLCVCVCVMSRYRASNVFVCVCVCDVTIYIFFCVWPFYFRNVAVYFFIYATMVRRNHSTRLRRKSSTSYGLYSYGF